MYFRSFKEYNRSLEQQINVKMSHLGSGWCHKFSIMSPLPQWQDQGSHLSKFRASPFPTSIMPINIVLMFLGMAIKPHFINESWLDLNRLVRLVIDCCNSKFIFTIIMWFTISIRISWQSNLSNLFTILFNLHSLVSIYCSIKCLSSSFSVWNLWADIIALFCFIFKHYISLFM